MNYIAGYLLAIYRDEEAAFRMLHAITVKYNMHELFNPEIPSLKLFFLQLDRMLSLTDADLSEQFEAEDVTSSYYASAWFITVFTNSLQTNVGPAPEHRVNESLLQIWDYFLLCGWKAVSKAALYMLRTQKPQIQAQPFEVILAKLTEAPKTLLAPEGHGHSSLY